MARPGRVFSGYWEPEARNPRKGGFFSGFLNPRIVIPIVLVLGFYLVYNFIINNSKPMADTVADPSSQTIAFNYVMLRSGEYILAQSDVVPTESLSDAMVLEEGFKNPPEGYIPIADNALISSITVYDNAVEVDFTEHPCPSDGERERLLAIAWTVGDFFNADLVKIKVKGTLLEEILN